MPLSGKLGFVSLDDLLSLLTRTDQQACVEVFGGQARGRIFITQGGIGLATTSEDGDLRDRLVRSGLIDEIYLDSVANGDRTLSPLVEQNGSGIVALIREITIESVYRLGLDGGSFEVHDGVTSHFASPHVFELEELLVDSKRRLAGWAGILSVVGDLGSPIQLIRDLADRDEVRIDRESWVILTNVRTGATVGQLAFELGTTEFWVARAIAQLIDQGLISVSTPETTVNKHTGTTFEEPIEIGADQSSESPTDYKETETAISQWGQPEPVAKSDEHVHPRSSWPDAKDEANDVDENTEPLLQDVFTEQESSTDPAEVGHGLHRRRLIRGYQRP